MKYFEKEIRSLINMKKLIIIAGSPNCGKTLTTNRLISKLIDEKHFEIEEYFKNSKEEFWNKDRNGKKNVGGAVALRRDNRKIAVVTYGDTEDVIEYIFEEIYNRDFESIVFCSHATRGRKVFDKVHEHLKGIDLNEVKVIPIHKNLLAELDKDKMENEYTANLIMEFLEV